jgi:FAD-dependent oxidoreductase family protein
MCIALMIGLSLAAAQTNAEPETYDVVVYGGTSAGVAAAVQVVRMGGSVVLVEPGNHLGGLTSGGLGATDIGNKAAIGGISREFYHCVYQHYQSPDAWIPETLKEYRDRKKGRTIDEGTRTMWGFEPRVAGAIFEDWLKAADILVVRNERLDLDGGVQMDDSRIAAIKMESGRTFRGRMFLDATYEGDLMAKSGVSYAVGREANSEYGETLNGVQKRMAIHHKFVVAVDPYVKPGDPTSGLLPGVQADPPGEDGSGDRRVQAYCFRMCTTDVPENRRPWPKPDGYDPTRYELLLRNCEAGDMRIPWNPVFMPNRKTDTNNNFAISTDNIGMNYDYPDGDHATREKIFAEHVAYQQGLMWTLANSPRVPEQVQRHFKTLGLAKDEFTDTDNWPHQLYVREARRMVSDYVMTEHHCTGRQVAFDSVGLGAYGMDSHHTSRYVSPEGHAVNEGDVEVGVTGPYPISYHSLVPAEGECANLLVPVCVSATHIAFGSIRMEPVFMILGQSAATAAMHAIEEKSDVQKISYLRLRRRLLDDGQVLAWTGPVRKPARYIDLKSLEGIVVDDASAKPTGHWAHGSSVGPFVGQGYLHDGKEDQGAKSIRFEAELPGAGRYEVRLAYSANPNRATNAAVAVHHADGIHRATINQKKAPTIKKAFVSLGTFSFQTDKPAVVVISNEAADGYVIADAVQFLPVK